MVAMGIFRCLQGEISTAEPEIEPGTSWLLVRSSDHQATGTVRLKGTLTGNINPVFILRCYVKMCYFQSCTQTCSYTYIPSVTIANKIKISPEDGSTIFS
jgi:hypothetical protein